MYCDILCIAIIMATLMCVYMYYGAQQQEDIVVTHCTACIQNFEGTWMNIKSKGSSHWLTTVQIESLTQNSISIHLPPSNFFSRSVFPMALAAWHICLSNSSNRRIHLMMLPSNASVILQSCRNGAPPAQAWTTSIR